MKERFKEVFWFIVDNQLARRLSFFAQLLLIIAVTYVLVRKFEMLDNQSTATVFNNSACSTPSTPSPSSSTFSPPLLCNTSQSFSKFLFFYCDGLARDLADPVLDVFADNLDVVRISNEGFPASYAIFTSYMTGKLPTNYLGSPIVTDSLPFQFKSAGIPMWYYGTKMPAFDVLQAGNFFDQHVIEYVNPATSTLYEQLFQCSYQNSSICAPNFLDNAKKDGYSVMFSGDVVDERNHLTGNKLDPQTLAVIEKFADDMQYVKQWVDENPEYLLVLVSDHGGKRPSDAGAHGVNDGGNEAFLAFYNPTLAPLPQDAQDAWIDTVDVCPTIWQFFSGSGVSIPAESCGKVHAMYNDIEDKYRVLKLNAMQMRTYAKWWGYAADEGTFKHALALEADGNLANALVAMEQYVDNLKKPLLDLKKFPLFEVVVYPGAYGTMKRFKSELFSARFPALIVTHFSFLFFSAMFSGYWVLWWWDTNQNIHIYGMLLLSSMTMYYSAFPPDRKPNSEDNTIEMHKLLSEDSADGDLSEEDIQTDSPSVSTDETTPPESTKQASRRCSLAYLVGNTRITPHNPQKWIFRYSIASFFMGVAIQVLHEPLESHVFSYLYKLSYLYAVLALWWEFVWQRRLLISHLVGPDKNGVVVYPAFHRVFWPLLYCFAFLLMFIYDRQWAGGVMNQPLAFIIYGIIFTHTIVLLFCNPDLALAVFALLFFLCSDRERTYLIAFIMPQYHCLSNLFYSRFEPPNSKITSKFVFNTVVIMCHSRKASYLWRTGAADHFLPLSVLLMINTAYWNFQVMQDTFTIGDVAVYVPGVMDPPTSPMFSAFIMGFHKMGYFFFLAAYLIRLMAPCPPALLPHPAPLIGHYSVENISSTRQRDSMRRHLWAFLMFFQLISAFFFHLGYYNFVLTKTFVWTMTVSIIVINFGVPLATSYLGDYLHTFAAYLWRKFSMQRHISFIVCSKV